MCTGTLSTNTRKAGLSAGSGWLAGSARAIIDVGLLAGEPLSSSRGISGSGSPVRSSSLWRLLPHQALMNLSMSSWNQQVVHVVIYIIIYIWSMQGASLGLASSWILGAGILEERSRMMRASSQSWGVGNSSIMFWVYHINHWKSLVTISNHS